MSAPTRTSPSCGKNNKLACQGGCELLESEIIMRLSVGVVTGIVMAAAGAARADEAGTVPRPVPLTRPEMKRYLEDMKARKPRIPLPELTAEGRAKLGDRADSYEARLRYHYLPGTAGRGGEMARASDPNMSLDYAFKTELFWIVSRTTNCHY